MGIRLTKPWLEVDTSAGASLPAQLGVFQLADDRHEVVYIGYGGGRELFGLRTAIEAAAATIGPKAGYVRFELTHGYHSRWEELLMVHLADHGRLPIANTDVDPDRLGRLSPGKELSGGSATE